MIVTDAVNTYLRELRPAPDPVLAEMEAHAARDRIPIVVPSTGQLLHVLVRACGARQIVEVGTAIGVSTLYMARALRAEGTPWARNPKTQAAAPARHVRNASWLNPEAATDPKDK